MDRPARLLGCELVIFQDYFCCRPVRLRSAIRRAPSAAGFDSR